MVILVQLNKLWYLFILYKWTQIFRLVVFFWRISPQVSHISRTSASSLQYACVYIYYVCYSTLVDIWTMIKHYFHDAPVYYECPLWRLDPKQDSKFNFPPHKPLGLAKIYSASPHHYLLAHKNVSSQLNTGWQCDIGLSHPCVQCVCVRYGSIINVKYLFSLIVH